MKQQLALFIITFFCIGACRQNEQLADPSNPYEPATILDCSQSSLSFSQPISNETYVDILEDSGKNILLLGNNLVEKYNNSGILIWSKKVGLLGTPQNIIQADGNNYFISSANYVVSDYAANEVYAPNAPQGSVLRLVSSYYRAIGKNMNCSVAYDKVKIGFNDSPAVFQGRNHLPTNYSTCQLTKINKSGEVIWNKTFPGNTLIGKSLAKTPDGCWLLLTSQCTGFYQTLQFDANGVFMDTIYAPKKGNTLTLYKITASGNVVWKHTLNNIEIPCSPYLKSSDSPIDMAVGNQHICICSAYDYFILDLNGQELSHRLPSVNTCNYVDPSVTSGNQYFYSFAYEKDTSINMYTACIQKSDEMGNVLHYFFNIASGKLTATNTSLFVMQYGFTSKYDLNGNLKWSKGNRNAYPLLTTPSCNDGLIYIERNAGGLNLIKTDPNGNY